MTFYTYTAEDSERLLSSYKKNDLARRALLYHAGDHLQNRKEWRGPIPKGANAEVYWQEIERCFVSNNVVKDGEERHNYGVLGREPMWSFDPLRKRKRKRGETKSTTADELDDYLVPWWDRRRMLLKFRRATTKLLVTRSGCLRLYISPTEARGEDALERALNRIYFTVPEHGQACVYTDPVTQQQLGVYEYQVGGERLVEYSFVREDGMTVIRTVSGSDAATLLQKAGEILAKAFGIPREKVVAEAVIDLGGELHIYEMNRDPLITEQVLQNQGLLNLALTMLPRNVIVGGFLEAVYKNAAKPTVKRLKAGSTTEYEEVETDEIEAGAGVRTFLVGVPKKDAEGNVVGVESVGVEWRNPVPVSTFDDTARIGERVILSQLHQKHVLEIGNESGEQGAEARQVARDDYEKSLLDTKGEIDPMGRWVLTVSTHAAVYISGEGERFLALRPSFSASIDVGPLNSEDKRMMQADVNEGRMSRQTYLIRIGVDDVTAELALIASDTALDTWIKRLEFIKAAKDLNFNVDAALKLAGVTDEQERRALIGETGAEPPPPSDDANADARLIA